MTPDGLSIRRTTRSTSGWSSHASMRRTRSPTWRVPPSRRSTTKSTRASVIVTDAGGHRWRLPRSARQLFRQWACAASAKWSRNATSRNIHGTFYEIPRLETKTVPDYRRMKPVASHRARIADFATWRGLLVLAGTRRDAWPDGHYFASGAAGDGLWFGAVDDLYKLGAPVGEGGPWKDTAIKAGEASDPFLMTNFGRKSVALSHDRESAGQVHDRSGLPRGERLARVRAWSRFRQGRPSCTGSRTVSPRTGCG